MAMVPMDMGDDHAGKARNLGGKQLLAQVGAAVDQESLAGTFNQDRGPKARIARLRRIALAPFVPDLRDARGSPAAGNPNFQPAIPWALLNNLKKMGVVASPRSSGSAPLSSAPTLAVSATKAGSHFWPRCGTGARKGESVSTSI